MPSPVLPKLWGWVQQSVVTSPPGDSDVRPSWRTSVQTRKGETNSQKACEYGIKASFLESKWNPLTWETAKLWPNPEL